MTHSYSRTTANPPSKQQRKTKYEPAIYICKETAENGELLKEYRCVHASQVNYGKPSDSNKIIRCKFNESFHFLSYFSKNLTNSSFISYHTCKAKPSHKFATTHVFLVTKKKNKSQMRPYRSQFRALLQTTIVTEKS